MVAELNSLPPRYLKRELLARYCIAEVKYTVELHHDRDAAGTNGLVGVIIEFLRGRLSSAALSAARASSRLRFASSCRRAPCSGEEGLRVPLRRLPPRRDLCLRRFGRLRLSRRHRSHPCGLRRCFRVDTVDGIELRGCELDSRHGDLLSPVLLLERGLRLREGEAAPAIAPATFVYVEKT